MSLAPRPQEFAGAACVFNLVCGESAGAFVAEAGGMVVQVTVQSVARFEFVLHHERVFGVVDSNESASTGACPNDITDVFVENPRDPRIGHTRVNDRGRDFVEDSIQGSAFS